MLYRLLFNSKRLSQVAPWHSVSVMNAVDISSELRALFLLKYKKKEFPFKMLKIYTDGINSKY